MHDFIIVKSKIFIYLSVTKLKSNILHNSDCFAPPLDKREFSEPSHEVDKTYNVLLLKNVRWLIGRNAFDCFVESFEEITVFVENKNLTKVHGMNDRQRVRYLII